jgi:hypothetical protein
MNLADLIAAENHRPGPECTVKRVLAVLPPKDAATLTKALTDVALTSAGLTRALRRLDLGFPVGNEAVQRHRKGECGCGPR